MAKAHQIFWFGDQTGDLSQLRPLLYTCNSPILDAFLSQAFHGLRAEIGELPSQDRQVYPHFNSVASIFEWRNCQTKANPAIESALTCLNHLAHFIE